MTKINKENFTKNPLFSITIFGWMLDFELSATELIAYAAIFNFSQDGYSAYQGTQGQLAKQCGTSRRNIHRVLMSLEHKGLITKNAEYISGVKHCRYSANVNKLPGISN